MKNSFNWKFPLKILAGIWYLSLAQQDTLAQESTKVSISSVDQNGLLDQFDIQILNGIPMFSLPVLSTAVIECTEIAITRYDAIASRGGWPNIPDYVHPLKIGMINPAVLILRKRLLLSGDLVCEAAGVSQTFDTYVEAAVKHFQSRHGLATSGIVDAATRAALNISVSQRLKQLHTNLKRLRKIIEKIINEKRFVMVNIPAAQIEAVQNGTVVQKHIAVVGKTDRQTPTLDSKIHEIIFNPFWIIPRSIIVKDLIPLMHKNPNYLKENDIHIYDKNNQEVSSYSIDWNTNQAENFLFRQNPGKINAMSSTKINFRNSYSVYMHDTPLQEQFNSFMRFDSSGCIRIENIRDFNLWLLQNTPGWGRSRMETIIRSRKNTSVLVKDPVPLHFVYITAWSNQDRVVQFRNDIYNKDNL